MELFLSECDHANTAFLSPDGRVVYHTNTSVKLFSGPSTKIYKHDAGFGRRQKEMGLVEGAGMFSTSEEFVASNDCLYKWKSQSGQILLRRTSAQVDYSTARDAYSRRNRNDAHINGGKESSKEEKREEKSEKKSSRNHGMALIDLGAVPNFLVVSTPSYLRIRETRIRIWVTT
ncbi:hypothetical protein D9758_010886 [Tetrapyrgos nigripes]|uniref:Uncharacterized protein n=1 Tax=Tetrapyrgos nigripes TaxID=182062 RepID=A0A8H5FST1_9AGAR|nr:hypothetical protein D9758_010886 [Tetrapyrgos nigripes]